ncbi:cyclic nucleotide-binding protein [Candidatus Magnetomorum sp. HK-1]|nr:cyclic nucleotide-binding protein [Candidatus Magnetomorum sp. HK-1]
MMIIDLLTRFVPIHIAKTEEEKNAIARFGYDIYVKELGYTPPGIDFDNKRLWDQHDDNPLTIHLYVGKTQQIKAIFRMLVWDAGNIDKTFFELYSMNLFPNIENLSVVEIGRVMIAPLIRGKLMLASLCRFGYKLLFSKGLGDLIFAECRPGLVAPYNKFGLRPYQAPLNKTPEGFMVPLVGISSDHKYHKKVKSIAYDLIPKYYGSKKRKPLDLSLYNHLFHENNQNIEFNEQKVFSIIEKKLLEPHTNLKIFNNMTDNERKAIIQKGIVLDITKQTETIAKGRTESEIYIILEGLFHVIVDDNVVSSLKNGDIFGEMAFFLENSKRTATIKSATKGKILMLNRKILNNLKEKKPDIAFKLLFNLGRILSHKLDTQSQYTRIVSK